MQENTNKAIVVNTIVMYLRLGITSIAGLFTTRYALQALGVSDFGIFSVVGGIISLITIINTIMLSTSMRFISVSVGRSDDQATNKVFNVSLSIHILIALLMAFIAIPIGKWYIINFVNFEGNINIVVQVFNISIIGSVISFIGVPYEGLIIAKEKFIVTGITNVFFSIIKALISYLLILHFENKLYVYAITVAICTCAPTFIYILYGYIKWHSLTKVKIVKDLALYREIILFSRWVGFGAVAQVGQSQGAALLVNVFFNTVMNTAQGIALTIKSLIMMVSQNLTKSISPQITKSYVAGNHNRCKLLIAMSSKFSFLAMMIISVPFIIDVNYLLNLWLGGVPEFAPKFVYLIIIDSLVSAFNMGLSEAIFANGNIKQYQLVINSNILLSIFVAYVVLKAGAPAYSLYYVYIGVAVVNTFVRQIILHKTLGYDNVYLIRKAYLPSIMVVIAFLPFLLIHFSMHPLLKYVIAELYLCILIYYIGLSKSERTYIVDKIKGYV